MTDYKFMVDDNMELLMTISIYSKSNISPIFFTIHEHCRVARLFTFHKFWTSVELLCVPMWSKKIVIQIFFDIGPKRSLCVSVV